MPGAAARSTASCRATRIMPTAYGSASTSTATARSAARRSSRAAEPGSHIESLAVVIARSEATKQSSYLNNLDCFASLAMTGCVNLKSFRSSLTPDRNLDVLAVGLELRSEGRAAVDDFGHRLGFLAERGNERLVLVVVAH